jgi:hypothetical protein
MNEYWVVKERSTGRVIAHCGDINDAMMMVSFDPNNRSYSRNRVLMDQVIDISSTTDKQLPGQLGLPAGKEKLSAFSEQNYLPEDQRVPINTK